MMQHYHIDGLVDYQMALPDETMTVVNPACRALEGEIKRKAGKLSRKRAEFGALSLETAPPSSTKMTAYERKKGEISEQIEFLEKDLAQLKAQRKPTPRHVRLGELPEPERFLQLAPARKQFIDTIRMIAYRAETAMAMILRDRLARPDDARSLTREIFMTEADLIPDEEEKTLTVRLHHLTNRLSDEAARYLATQMNATETLYPGTDLRLIYKLVSDDNPPDQES